MMIQAHCGQKPVPPMESPFEPFHLNYFSAKLSPNFLQVRAALVPSPSR